MAVRLIPNQLVKLYDTETFNQRNKRLMWDYRTYCQIVRDEQTTMFQVQLLPDSVNLVTNGDFVSDISGWVLISPTWQWASGRLQAEKTGVVTPQIRQDINVTANRVYKLTLTAQFAQLHGELSVTINTFSGSTDAVIEVFRAIDYGTQPFEITMFWDSGTAVTSYVLFGLQGASLRDLVYIDDVAMYRLSEPTVTLERCTGDLVRTIDVFARADDVINYAVEWYGLSEDCYRICLTGVDDTEKNYLDDALALDTEGGENIELEQGSNLNWYG